MCEVYGGGPGLVQSLYKLAGDRGIQIRFNARALNLIHDDTGVHGVNARVDGKTIAIRSKAVVLACGGFEANAEMRARYLGPGWDTVHVRGVPFNTGDGFRMAIDIGALPHGSWSTCHASPQDIALPKFTLPSVHVHKDSLHRYMYPYAIKIGRAHV